MEKKITTILPSRENAKLKLDHKFAAIGSAPSVQCGDLNAHHTIWNDPTSNSANRTCFTCFIAFKRDQFSTQKERVLDLTFLSTNLPFLTWATYPYLSSDHFATVISLDTPQLQLPTPIPRWNVKRTCWIWFTAFMDNWPSIYSPSDENSSIFCKLEKHSNNILLLSC